MKKFFRGPFDYRQEVTPPLIDLYETAEKLVFKADLPGIDPDDVLVKVYEDILIIEGLKQAGETAAAACEGPNCLFMEENFKTFGQSFRRVLRLPAAVNAHGGTALYRGGVLIISFPKITDKVVKIKIETSEE